MTAEQVELFHVDPPSPDPLTGLSVGRRRTLRQRVDVDRGIHPLTRGKTRPDVGTCGTCIHRVMRGGGGQAFPKCDLGPQTRGVSTDVRRWWPACDRYQKAVP